MADEVKGVAGVGVDERVTSLEEALSVEKAKNEVLMEQILKAENGLAEAVSAFASPQEAMSATLSAMVKKFGWASTTNLLVSAAESCTDGSCSDKKQHGPLQPSQNPTFWGDTKPYTKSKL